MDTIRLGEIIKTFGLEGQVRCFSLTDFAKERFKKGTPLLLVNERSGEKRNVTVKSFRGSSDGFFLGFEEIPTIDEAEKILHFSIEIDRTLAPLPKGYYRFEDLKGCQVKDENGLLLGTVETVLSYAPTKTLKVTREGGRPFYVPFLMKEFVISINIEKKEIIIHVIAGLL